MPGSGDNRKYRIVLTATGSQRPIISRDDIQAVTGRRRQEPLFIIDVAVPGGPRRTNVSSLAGLDIDDLRRIHAHLSGDVGERSA